ncbi:MAG: flippase-like domain-containing protein [Armatimonadetes bacterium]|nr:flippase-like domain-containing protein [Armatimonadota bacterium]
MMVAKRQLQSLAGVLVSIITISFFLYFLDVHRLWTVIANGDYRLFLLALVVNIFANLAAAERLRQGLVLFQRRLPFSWIAALHYAALWFNQVLPTGLGGDVIRYLILKGTIGRIRAVRAVLFDRVFGVVFLFIAGTLAFPILVFDSPSKIASLVWLLAAPGALLGVVTSVALARRLRRRTKAWKLINLVLLAGRDLGRGLNPLRAPRLWVQSLLFCGGSILAYYFVALAFDTTVQAYHFLWAVPVIFTLMQFPLSYGGWGPREAAALLVFSGLENEVETIVAIAGGFGIVLMLSAVPGLFILWGRARQFLNASERPVVS